MADRMGANTSWLGWKTEGVMIVKRSERQRERISRFPNPEYPHKGYFAPSLDRSYLHTRSMSSTHNSIESCLDEHRIGGGCEVCEMHGFMCVWNVCHSPLREVFDDLLLSDVRGEPFNKYRIVRSRHMTLIESPAVRISGYLL